ncbi:MAG: FMN-binding protein, partial [Christensenellaceae bacterium]|nr:FMN-binding protein [Christensenellaceae bacterium]
MENNTSAKKGLPAFVILGIIALVAALVLAVTNAITKGPIAEHQIAALREAFAAVMPADEYEEITVPASYNVSSLYAAKTGGEVAGYCVTAVGKGYNGDVAVTMGVGLDGLVTGVVVGDTNFAETSGYGARAKEPAFQEQFEGLDAVNGGSFQALSGATVTSTAVLNAVNRALTCVDEVALNKEPAAVPLVSFGAPAEREVVELTGEVLEGSAWGFKSDVTVQITLDADGAISGINVDTSDESEGYGQRLMTEPFVEQFIGQTGPFAIGENINVLSGASVTSRAVVEAVNSLLAAPTSAGAELPVTSIAASDDADLGVRADGAAVVVPAEDYSGELSIELNVKNGQVVSGGFAESAEA